MFLILKQFRVGVQTPGPSPPHSYIFAVDDIMYVKYYYLWFSRWSPEAQTGIPGRYTRTAARIYSVH